ncbi:MAG: hypothetical protein A2136_10840 [Chloroflexi bacterium RBG_16_54_11]|nr:MAG: hypothetical protein A2136_10840 [Chloroflexi bacterium RBG_16_54_11]
MLPLEHARALKQEAETILEVLKLKEILHTYGKNFLTGSYFLDVMVYPDIDLFITKVSIEQIFEIGAQIANSELVTRVVFERTDDPAQMPGGLYLKPRLNYGDWGRPWKFDNWSPRYPGQ